MCRSFKTITYSGTKDRKEQIIQIRQHNAALSVFKCEAL